MKKLGLVGGLGPESTLPYYRGLVYGVQKKLNRDEFPNLTVESLNVFQVLGLCGEGDYEGLTEYILGAVRNLAAAGADFAAISANTPHIIFDELQRRSPLPLVSIVETACQEAGRRGYQKIGLLGTRFTMEGEFFRKPFEKHGIQVVIPTPEEVDFIAERIGRELEHGIVTAETQEGVDRVLRRMTEDEGIEAAILGCTELPMLYQNHAAPLPTLDTMQIHIDALVEKILEE